MKTMRQARVEKGLRQLDIARYMGKSVQWARDVENGSYKLLTEHKEKLEEIIGQFDND